MDPFPQPHNSITNVVIIAWLESITYRNVTMAWL